MPHLTINGQSVDLPFGRTILEACETARIEVPTLCQRCRMSVTFASLGGKLLLLKGAPEVVIPLCDTLEIRHTVVPLEATHRAEIKAVEKQMAGEGLRVLALAFRALSGAEDSEPLEEHLAFGGLIALEDPPRPEVRSAVAKCRGAGIKVIMITGDHPQTALAVARQIGLVRSAQPVVITGDELRTMSSTQLQLVLSEPEILFARVAADQKLRIVSALKLKNEVVAVTGDGVNDAPALKQADIGISMGISGTDVARESADMIWLDDNFATVVSAIEEGRAVYANIRKFLTYILTSNISEIVPYLAFVLFRIPLPLTVVQILAVDLGTDMVPALGLGSEWPDHGIMNQPPRSRHERLLNFALIARANRLHAVGECRVRDRANSDGGLAVRCAIRVGDVVAGRTQEGRGSVYPSNKNRWMIAKLSECQPSEQWNLFLGIQFEKSI